MNEIQKVGYDELDNLANEVMRSAGAQRMLKFRKGDYFCDEKEVEKGTQFIAHVVGWRKDWIKFTDRKVAERRIYRVIRGERAPERYQMPDYDEESRKLWPIVDGKQQDPWALQYLLPMESLETGETLIFVTYTVGGKKAVEELVDKYTTRRKRDATVGQPLVRIQKTMMPVPAYGPTVRPAFEIVSFEAAAGDRPMREVGVEAIDADADMADEIPF